MKYLELTEPHGFLIWRGKQTAIASDKPLLTDEKALVVSGGRAFGEVVLSQPMAVNLTEFERLEKEHTMRPEERRLHYPEAETFYIHRFAFEPFSDSKEVKIEGEEAELVEPVKLTEEQRELVERAEKLPKTLILNEDVVTLTEDGYLISDLLEGAKIEPILKAVFEDLKSDSALPLYQLALVRTPRFGFKAEGTKPWKVITDSPECEDGHAVIKIADGKVVGCHDNPEDALAQVRALYSGEDKGSTGSSRSTSSPKKKPSKGGKAVESPFEETYETALASKSFSDWVTDYYNFESKDLSELSDEEAVKAAWTAKYINTLPNSSFLYVEKNCDKGACRHLPYKDADGEIDLPHLRNAASRLGQSTTGEAWLTDDLRKKLQAKVSGLLNEDEKAGRRVRQSMLDKMKTAWSTLKELVDWAEKQEIIEEEEIEKFFGKKGTLGIKKVGDQWWYMTWSTNAFKDRESEIFSTKSLENYVLAAEQKEDRGFFNLWHMKDTDFAEKKWQGVVGRFLVEAGPFLKDEKGQKALEFFKQYSEGHPELAPEGWGCSPEYRYLPEERKTGVYDNIWITRTSTLPRLAAANTWTLGGKTMALTVDQKKAAQLIFGEELSKEIEEAAMNKTKELEEAGVAHKEVSEEEETQEVVTSEVNPDQLIEAVATVVAQKMTTDWEPLQGLLEKVIQNQEEQETRLAQLSEELKGFQKVEEVKSKAETPRFVLSLLNRASEADKTVVSEGDPLKDKKPQETKQDKSGAAAYFGS